MAEASNSMRAPVREVAGRYAQALLSLAEEGRAVKTVEKDMKSLGAMFAKGVDLVKLVDSPVIASEAKKKALLTLAKKAKIGKVVSNFIGTVCDNGRAEALPEMIAAFATLLAEQRGLETAYVTSASKLSPAQLKSLKATLKKTLGRDVQVKTQINTDLLGGFAVQIGSKYFDYTLKTRLDGLKLALREA